MPDPVRRPWWITNKPSRQREHVLLENELLRMHSSINKKDSLPIGQFIRIARSSTWNGKRAEFSIFVKSPFVVHILAHVRGGPTIATLQLPNSHYFQRILQEVGKVERFERTLPKPPSDSSRKRIIPKTEICLCYP